MTGRIPARAWLLAGITLAGLVLLAAFQGRLATLLQEPPITPGQWCVQHPCVVIGGIVLNEPSSTILVYGLAALTIVSGMHFLRTRGEHASRAWWGIGFVLTGAGAGLAGTSYQAFAYEIKCRGTLACAWTSWWELAYMACTVAGAAAVIIAVAHATLPARERQAWSAVAIAFLGIYVSILVVGAVLPDRFLVSFELMVLFFAVPCFAMFSRNAWVDRERRSPVVRAIVGVWTGLVVVIAVYYVALLVDVGATLWAAGIWFNENDVLHVMMAAWVVHAWRAMDRRLVDLPGPAGSTGEPAGGGAAP